MFRVETFLQPLEHEHSSDVLWFLLLHPSTNFILSCCCTFNLFPPLLSSRTLSLFSPAPSPSPSPSTYSALPSIANNLLFPAHRSSNPAPFLHTSWPNTKTVWILSIPPQLTTMSTMSSPFFSFHPRSFPYKRIINHMGSKEAAIKFVPQRSGGRANIYNHQCVGGRGSPASRGGSPEYASRKPNTAQARFRSINSRQL